MTKHSLSYAADTGIPHSSAIIRLLRLWRRRSQTRRNLADIDARLLADVGLNTSDRDCECRKRFWRK